MALRRAAVLGDGFIFADGAFSADAFDQMARLRQYLKAAGRSEDGFGFHCNANREKSQNHVVETAKRWRDAGGTHFSVETTGREFTTVDQHLDYMKRMADTLRAAGLELSTQRAG